MEGRSCQGGWVVQQVSSFRKGLLFLEWLLGGSYVIVLVRRVGVVGWVGEKGGLGWCCWILGWVGEDLVFQGEWGVNKEKVGEMFFRFGWNNNGLENMFVKFWVWIWFEMWQRRNFGVWGFFCFGCSFWSLGSWGGCGWFLGLWVVSFISFCIGQFLRWVQVDSVERMWLLEFE